MLGLFRYFLFASAAILLFHPYLASANWPVARYTNGTVGLINDGGEVHVQSAKLQVNGHLKVEGDLFVNSSNVALELTNLKPPKCLPPGGDKLQFDGTYWICICYALYSGPTCEIKGQPIPLTDDTISSAGAQCLAEDPLKGNCQIYALESGFGSMWMWDVSAVTKYAFQSNVFNGDVSNWNTSSMTTMEGMFSGLFAFNQDISKWNTSKVTNMYRMFKQASAFNGNISDWDTGQVTTMYDMFQNAHSFNQPIGSWVTEKVTQMVQMFNYASSFNQDISSWDTSSVGSFSSIFEGATAFQAKYTCASSTSIHTDPSSCTTIRSDWIAPPPPPASPSPPPSSPPTGDCVSGYFESFASDGGTAMCLYAYGASYPSLCATNGAGENDGVCANTYTSGDFLYSHSCRVNGAWDEVCIANLCLSSELCTGYQKTAGGTTYWLQGGSGSQASYSNSNYKCCRKNLPLPPQLQWHLAESSSDDCDVVCAAHGKVCNADALQFDYVALSGNYVDLFAAASSAGISCNNGGGTGSISAPIYHNDNCYQYNPPSNQVCSGSGGYGLRICPCV